MRMSSTPGRRGVALMRSSSCVTSRSKRVGWPKEVGPEGDEQIAVVALGIRARAGAQSQRLHHERKPEPFVTAERQQGAAPCCRWIPGRLAPGGERDAFGK